MLPFQPRGTNWLPDALKALLQVGILRREKIRGCEAVGDVRNETHKELSGMWAASELRTSKVINS